MRTRPRSRYARSLSGESARASENSPFGVAPGLAPPVQEPEVVMRVHLLGGRRAVEDGLKVAPPRPRSWPASMCATPRLFRASTNVGVEVERVRERLHGARVVLLVEQREPERVRDVRIPRRARAAPAGGSGSPRPRGPPGAWRGRSGSRRDRRGPGSPSEAPRRSRIPRDRPKAREAAPRRRTRPGRSTPSRRRLQRDLLAEELEVAGIPRLVERGDHRRVERFSGEGHDLA